MRLRASWAGSRVRIPAMGKPQEDLQDGSFIAEDLLRFAAMTFDELKRHIEEHPEDKMHWVDIPGRGHRPITREAARRFAQLARRQRAIDPDEHAIDLSTLDRSIRPAFVEMFIIEGRPVEGAEWIKSALDSC